ncbi:MAG: hypothetical protein ACOVMP_08055 [Chthoniobacterales bacterium]
MIKQYAIGYLVARLSVALALAVLILGLAGSALSWSVFGGKIEAARVPPDAGLMDAIESINAAQRAAIEELRTSGLPVSRNELLNPRYFEGQESIATLERRLDMLAEAREVVVFNQNEVVSKVGAGFDELIGQLNDLAGRTTAVTPPDEQAPAPSEDASAADAADGDAPSLFIESTNREVYLRRIQALDAAKVALLSLMTEVQKPENRDRIQSTLAELASLERLITRATQDEAAKDDTSTNDEIGLNTGAARAKHIASVLAKRKTGVVSAVVGDWAVLNRIDSLARSLETRRQQLELSETTIANLEVQRNIICLGLVIIGFILAIVLGAAGDVARAILDCAKYLSNM